jgi:ABC-2 type transport system permease protein
LIFLIPRNHAQFSDEKKEELLVHNKTVEFVADCNGKFLGAVLLIVMAIIPTFILCRSNLKSWGYGNLDMGAPLVLMLGCYS